MVVGAACVAMAETPAPAKIDLNPLDCRWTFGNHEPIAMYRRAGNRVTGGIEGSALWLEDWHHWFDSEASARLMQELGLNILHCRFYKGMGWQHESRDFPNVKRFVDNCHKHEIRVLAYVQFSTLYYETMLAEIPDLADWASLDENGRKRTYHAGAYYRWLPCINAPGFEPYLKKLIAVALEEGGFEGIMFDNCHVPACYCPRCAALFREHLAEVPDPEMRFGIPTVEHVLTRRFGHGIRRNSGPPLPGVDTVLLRASDGPCTAGLYLHAKACKPSAIVSGNIQNIRRANMAATAGLIATDLDDCFDVFVSQSGNSPGVVDGCLINRVREMKLAAGPPHAHPGPLRPRRRRGARRTRPGAMCFGARGRRRLWRHSHRPHGHQAGPRKWCRPSASSLHRPMLERFNETVRAGRKGLAAPSYANRCACSTPGSRCSSPSNPASRGADPPRRSCCGITCPTACFPARPPRR